MPSTAISHLSFLPHAVIPAGKIASLPVAPLPAEIATLAKLDISVRLTLPELVLVEINAAICPGVTAKYSGYVVPTFMLPN
jgi:hypothetical protein